MKGHGVGFFVIYKKSYCGLIAALKKNLSWKRSKVKPFQCCQNFLALFCMNYANVEYYVWCRNYPKVMEVKWANFCINVTSSFRACSKLYFHFKVNYFLKWQDLHSYLLNKKLFRCTTNPLKSSLPKSLHQNSQKSYVKSEKFRNAVKIIENLNSHQIR